MTKENGKVVVILTVPALGQITGTIPLSELMDPSTAKEDGKIEASVETKPLPSKK